MSHSIVVLFHARTLPWRIGNYVVTQLAEIWRKDGHRVEFLYGTDRFVPADVCLIHVDLTVVPPEYLEFASRYPVVVNGRFTDISRRRYTRHRVSGRDGYTGPVIVKSNENYAGWPELIAGRYPVKAVFSRLLSGLRNEPRRFYSSADYRIYDSIRAVPERYRRDPGFLVEKFLPEEKEGMYYLNMFFFFGSFHECHKIGGRNPVVKGVNCIVREKIEPHPEVIRAQHELGLDYGKIDYCLNQGRMVLVDVNRIVGAGRFPRTYTPRLENRARAMYEFFADAT